MLHSPRPCLYTLSRESLGTQLAAVSSSSPGNAAWPAANDAIFIPFVIDLPILAKRLYVVNGNVTSGNLDLGIYTFNGARIVSTGSTAQAGASAPQLVDITDTYLSPGQYYMACAMNGTTGGSLRLTTSVVFQRAFGVYKMATAFALPATATFATPTAAYVPLIGIEMANAVI